MNVTLGKGTVVLSVATGGLRRGLARATGILRGCSRAAVSSLRGIPGLLGVAGVGGAVA